MFVKKKDFICYMEICNVKVLCDYFVDEKFEVGIVLKGIEVKLICVGCVQISDLFGCFDKGEFWLMNVYIEEYVFGNIYNYDMCCI